MPVIFFSIKQNVYCYYGDLVNFWWFSRFCLFTIKIDFEAICPKNMWIQVNSSFNSIKNKKIIFDLQKGLLVSAPALGILAP